MHSPAWEAELWTSFSTQPYTFNFLDLPTRSFFLLHKDRKLSFLTLGRVRSQTPVFGCQSPFPKDVPPSSTHWCGTRACLTRVTPREQIQLLFIGLDRGERGPDQTDPQGAGDSSGMHIFQSKNGSQPTSPAQHQPFPLFIPGLQGAIAAHLPSQHPHKGSSTAPLPGNGITRGTSEEEEKVKSHRSIRTKPRVTFWGHLRISYLCSILPYPKSTGGFGSVEL